MSALPADAFIVEVEQEVLGAILLGSDMRRVHFLQPGHFREPLHQRVFANMQVAFERYGSANPVVVYKLFSVDEAKNIAAKLGKSIPAYLAALSANTVYGPARLEQSARRVVEQWGRLCIADEAQRLFAAASDPSSNPVDLISVAGQAFDEVLSSVRSGPKRKTRLTVAEAVDNAVAASREASARGSGLTGITWGLSDVNRVTGGMQRRDLTLLAARPSMGKAQPLTVNVRTPSGWRTMGSLRVGDEVSSVDGLPSYITGIFPQGQKQVYRVTFSDGRSTRCCADHLWQVYYRDWNAGRVLATEALIKKLATRRYQKRLWIDMPVVAGRHDSSLPLDPWVLGALIGDGGLSGGAIRFSSASQETIDRMAERLPDVCQIRRIANTSYDYAVTMKERTRTANGWPTPNFAAEALRDLGLFGLRSEEKFLPRIYLDGSKPQRLDLLRGLLDTDGWVERHGSVCFGTSSKRLADDVCELARSLGAWCSIRPRQKSYTYKGERKKGLPSYTCVISHSDPASLFLMTAKIDGAKARARRKFPTLVGIAPDGFEESQCISVSHPSKLYVTDDYVVTHNTTVGLSAALSAAKSGRGVGFISLEMDADKLGARAITDLAYDWGVKVPYADVIKGRADAGALQSLQQAARDLDTLPLWIEDQSGMSMTDIRIKTEALMAEAEKAGTPLEVLFIDHLGLIKPSSRYQGNRVNEVTEMSGALKSLAREYGIAVIALSQLNRALEGRNDKRPQLSDLRDSGSLEQDADTIVFLYREAYYLEREQGGSPEQLADRTERLIDCQNKLEFHIAKQRNGPITMLELFADMACSAVRNWGRQ